MTNPFDWKGKPSVFAKDKEFKPLKNGKTRSQTSSEGLQKVYDKGINSATVLISDKTEGGMSEAFKRIHRREK
jgi:hypothetical protein